MNDTPAFFLDGTDLKDGIALCLSGGGYRAMLFHAGSIWRLNELGLLRKLNLVSSVSGGSITSGALAVAWKDLQWDAGGRATNLAEKFIAPIQKQAEDGIDYESIAIGLLPWEAAFQQVAKSYAKNIIGDATTLQDLPGDIEFVFNTTSLMTGRDWNFSRAYAGDYRVGSVLSPRFLLSEVVAASSAFPPFLSPATFDLTGYQMIPPIGDPSLFRPPYTSKTYLFDGGVYDNMGLEPAWKRFRTLLVSNAGRPFAAAEAPHTDWFNQLRRILDITMDQEEALRVRILIYTYQAALRHGAVWGLGIRVSDTVPRPALLSPEEDAEANGMRTRLNVFTAEEQNLLMKAGYAHADEAIRKRYAPFANLPTDPGVTPPQVV
jgi:NTE family protein